MSDKFGKALLTSRQKYRELRASHAYSVSTMPKKLGVPGIYLLTENGWPMYVGRTDNVRKRIQQHTRNNPSQASLAFLIARRKTRIKANYRSGESRAALLARSDPFREAFDRARMRIRKMNVQHVRVADGATQAILEVYAALKCKTKYNDFGNH